MSKLLAYNLTGSPIALAAGNSIATLPASLSPPDRGPAVNVTAELQGLSGPDYALLQAQVTADSIAIEWDGEPDWSTPGLYATYSANVVRDFTWWPDNPRGSFGGSYTSFNDCHADMRAAVAQGYGPVRLFIYSQDSTYLLPVLGLPAAQVPANPAGGGAGWDMDGIEIGDHATTAVGPPPQTNVTFAQDAFWDNVSFIKGRALAIYSQAGVTSSPIRLGSTTGPKFFTTIGLRVDYRCEDPTAVPLIKAIPGAVFVGMNSDGSNQFSNYGDGVNTAPVIDAAGCPTFAVLGGILSDFGIEDSVGGAFIVNGAFSSVNNNNFGTFFVGGPIPNFNFPGVSSATSVMVGPSFQRSRMTMTPPVSAPTYQATLGESVRVSTLSNPVAVTLPRGNPSQGDEVEICDYTGNAGVSAITVLPLPANDRNPGSAADTINLGSTPVVIDVALGWVKLRNDGFGNWKVVAKSVGLGEIAAAQAKVFVSAEQTATGASQDVAHGLAAAPSLVLLVPTAGDNGAGAAGTNMPTLVEGAHDTTNVKATVTAGAKFKVLAWV